MVEGEWFKIKCPSCVNFEYKCNGEYCGKFSDGICQNYRDYIEYLNDKEKMQK